MFGDNVCIESFPMLFLYSWLFLCISDTAYLRCSWLMAHGYLALSWLSYSEYIFCFIDIRRHSFQEEVDVLTAALCQRRDKDTDRVSPASSGYASKSGQPHT